MIETRGSRKKVYDVEQIVSNKTNKRMSVSFWLLKKEWLIVKRTPIFMLNIVVIVFLMPIIIIVSFLVTFISSGESVNDSVLSMIDINSMLGDPIVYLIVFAVAVFFTSTSVAASTSISREGSNAWFMKIIPVSYFKQINIKVLFAVIIDMLGIIILGIVPVILFKVPLYYVLCIFIPLLLLVILINYFNILLDLKRPRLNWSEESEAVKQNINSMISIFGTMGVCGVFAFLAYILYKYNISINVVLLSSIISAFCGIILAFVIYYIYKNSSKLVENIE